MAGLALLMGLHQAQLRADDAVKAEGKATVTVTVVDSSGKAVADAKVDIYAKVAKKHKNGDAASEKDAGATSQPTEATPKKAEPVASGETGADGTVELTKVPNGSFTIRARVKGAGTGNAKLLVEDDKDQSVTVTLKAKAEKN
jgi:hypothetical protein